MTAIFLHIPKNGGTALRRIVRSQYRRDEVYLIGNDDMDGDLEALQDLSAPQQAALKAVLCGHCGTGPHEALTAGAEARYFAMLREPVSRTVSYYEFAKRRPDHFLHAVINGESLSLLDFLGRDDLNMEVCNGQTALLAGTQRYSDIVSGTAARVSEADRDTAIEHIASRYLLLGCMERYPQTLYLLKQELGWTRDIRNVRYNVNPHIAPSLSASERERILELNRFDTAIYASALSRLDERIAGIPPEALATFVDAISAEDSDASAGDRHGVSWLSRLSGRLRGRRA